MAHCLARAHGCMQAEEGIVADRCASAQRCVWRQHREIPGRGVVPKRAVVVHERKTAEADGVAGNRIWAEDRAGADAGSRGDECHRVDEREEQRIFGEEVLGHMPAGARCAQCQEKGIGRFWNKRARIAKYRQGNPTERVGRKEARDPRNVVGPGVASPTKHFPAETAGPHDKDSADMSGGGKLLGRVRAHSVPLGDSRKSRISDLPNSTTFCGQRLCGGWTDEILLRRGWPGSGDGVGVKKANGTLAPRGAG